MTTVYAIGIAAFEAGIIVTALVFWIARKVGAR